MNYKFVNEHIDSCFENALKSCYTDFSEITQALISCETIQSLVSLYKQYLPMHYNYLMAMFGFDKQ